MKYNALFISAALIVSSLSGCSKHSQATTSTSHLVVLVGTNYYMASNVVTRGTNGKPQTNLVVQVGTNHYGVIRITNAPSQTNEGSK